MTTTHHSDELQRACDLRQCPVCGESRMIYAGATQMAEACNVVAMCPCGGRDDFYWHAGEALSVH